MAARATSQQPREEEAPVRQRILDAAFSAFMESGFAQVSTLEIATRARVSKRELYSLVGNKQEMLIACIGERAKRLRAPAGLPEPHDREALARALQTFGTQLLHEVSDPTVIAVFRLAIAEAIRTPEVARALDSIAGETSRSALRDVMTRARSFGLVSGQPAVRLVGDPGIVQCGARLQPDVAQLEDVAIRHACPPSSCRDGLQPDVARWTKARALGLCDIEKTCDPARPDAEKCA